MSNITVRLGTPGDVDALVASQQAMASETEGKTLDAPQLRKGINTVFNSSDKGFYLVAQAEGEVVGTLLITYEWSDWRNATFWWVQSVYVDPSWRRRGVYRAMHECVRETASARKDVCGLRLYVDKDNHVAQQTYADLGMINSRYDMYEMDIPV
mgnify:FL=1